MDFFVKSVKWLIWLLMAVGTAQVLAAQWSATGLTDDVEYGIDRSSISRQGEMRTVWTMLDYRKVQHTSLGKPYWCAAGRWLFTAAPNSGANNSRAKACSINGVHRHRTRRCSTS